MFQETNSSFSALSINKYYRFSVSWSYDATNPQNITGSLLQAVHTLAASRCPVLCRCVQSVMKRLPYRCNHLHKEFFISALQTPPVMRVGTQRTHLYWASLLASTTNTKNIGYLAMYTLQIFILQLILLM